MTKNQDAGQIPFPPTAPMSPLASRFWLRCSLARQWLAWVARLSATWNVCGGSASKMPSPAPRPELIFARFFSGIDRCVERTKDRVAMSICAKQDGHTDRVTEDAAQSSGARV